MKFRHTPLGAAVLLGCIVVSGLFAQDVIIGDPGWFKTEGAPDQPPQSKRRPHVEYPDVLLTSDESSYVILARFLDEKGHGLMIEAHSTHPWFRRAVEEAVGDWPMTPAKRGGQPVASWFWTPVIFNPKSAAPDRTEAKPRLRAVTPVIIPDAMMIKLRENTSAWGTISLDAAGAPQKVTLEPPASDKLQPFVENALKQWRFAPARKGGQPVAADFRVAFHFFPAMAPVPTKAMPPRVVRQEPPIYPYGLRKSGIVGEVLVGFVVDSKGNVVNAIAVRSNSPAFNEAAVEAVRKWKFEPAIVDGRPVNCRMTVPIVFDLNDGSGREQVTVKSASRQAQKDMPEAIRYDVAPRPRGVVQPVYPYSLLRAGTTGKATVLFQIDPEGRVVAVKVAEATHSEFGLALTAAVEL
jgi:TonB family protein